MHKTVLVVAFLACGGHGSRLQPGQKSLSHSGNSHTGKSHTGNSHTGNSGKDIPMLGATEQQSQEGAKAQSGDGKNKIWALLVMAFLVCSLCLGCACYTASRGSGRQNASPERPPNQPSGTISPSAGNSNTEGLGWWALRVPGAIWPSFLEKEGKFHRFITENDPTFQKYIFNEVTGYSCKTSGEFRGTRRDGVYEGSFRVQFTLHDKDDEPKTIELMRSREEDKPSFGAVKIALPVNITVFSKDSRLAVKRISKGSNAENARMREGDIIRAVSLTETSDTQEEVSRWSTMFGHTPLPTVEEGMAILDGKSVADYNAVLQENTRVHGKTAQVVLILERPGQIGSSGDNFSRATAHATAETLTPRTDDRDEPDPRQAGSNNAEKEGSGKT